MAAYYATLDRYRLLTYGQQVVTAVRELSRPELAAEVHAALRHLIVDEYQDVNPAQERLIGLLAGPGTELCVVGNDHQAIYQWRGSDVANIVGFAGRYPSVATFKITTNRRSRPGLIDVANRFSATIPASLPKTMTATRAAPAGGRPEVVVWSAPTEADEAGWIAGMIDDLAGAGVAYRDMAVLVRSRAAYPALRDAFAAFDIPVQPGGRTGLFDQPEALLLGQTFAWLSDIEWRDPYGRPRATPTDGLLDDYGRVFPLSPNRQRLMARFLDEWKTQVPREEHRADLIGELYLLAEHIGVASWDLDDPLTANRLGTLARFTSLLADYESVRRRARPDPSTLGEQVGGQDRGLWYYRNLAIHIVNYAQGAYEGFDGEADYAVDAVDVTTVHRAKGLEWPVVFVPSMTAARFPTRQTSRPQAWLVPRERFAAARYEGSDADERRLFYVAMTRARDWLSVSRHDRVTKNAMAPSPTTASSPAWRSTRRRSARQRSRPAAAAKTSRSRSATASWPRSSTAAWPSGCATSSGSSPDSLLSSATAKPSTTSCGPSPRPPAPPGRCPRRARSTPSSTPASSSPPPTSRCTANSKRRPGAW
jgi:DNA helicase-2/ATP-dependent DNA helicase PcrA